MMNSKLTILSAILTLSFNFCYAQKLNQVNMSSVSKVWIADLGNGKYKNPIINADYSDPDAIRVNDDFYMVSSSFDAVPGIPILHSKDLVNWTIIGHALLRQPPFDHFSKTQHGNGVWAPAIRYHNGMYYIYYPDPDFGIYVVKSNDPAGAWSEPILVQPGKGLIDPCPLWDEDGKVYLIHAYAGSRAGIKSILVIKELNSGADKVLTAGAIVYDGHEADPTLEGPKIYKRNSFYYIFAPAGGVSTGWQLVLRSKNVYGPYERKVVMDQGTSTINGPHQGAWVDTPKGEDWFLHFQDKGVYGRVIHLQPLKWVKDWPVIGVDEDGNGIGTPVSTFKKPDVGKSFLIATPQESDEFNERGLGLQWQWQANPKETWLFHNVVNGSLRLYTEKIADTAKNYWDVPQLLMQKFPAEEFSAITKLTFSPNNKKLEGEKVGLIVMGASYAYLSLKSTKNQISIVYSVCTGARTGAQEMEKTIGTVNGKVIFLKVSISKGGLCRFSYSFDQLKFIDAGPVFQAEAGQWIGAKVGLFATRPSNSNDSGYADFDWFRINP